MQICAVPGVPHSLPTEKVTLLSSSVSARGRLSPQKLGGSLSMLLPHPRPRRRRPLREAGSPHSPPLLAGRCAGMAGHTLRNRVPSSQRLQRRALKPPSRLPVPVSRPGVQPEKNARFSFAGKRRHLAILRALHPAPESRWRETWRSLVFVRTLLGDCELFRGPRVWGSWVLLQKSALNELCDTRRVCLPWRARFPHLIDDGAAPCRLQ